MMSCDILMESSCKTPKTVVLNRGWKRRIKYTRQQLLTMKDMELAKKWPKALSCKCLTVDGLWDPVKTFEKKITNRKLNRESQYSNSDGMILYDHDSSRGRRQRDEDKSWEAHHHRRGWYTSNDSAVFSLGSMDSHSRSHYYGNGSRGGSGYRYDRYYPSGSSGPRGHVLSRGGDYCRDDDYSQEMGVDSDEESARRHWSGTRNRARKNQKQHSGINTEPEWFSGGPSNINETIELRGMMDSDMAIAETVTKSKEAKIKLTLPTTNQEEKENIFLNHPTNSKINEPSPHGSLSPQDDQSLSKERDAYLLSIIKRSVPSNSKHPSESPIGSHSIRELEDGLKAILLKDNGKTIRPDTTDILNPPRGVLSGQVRTVDEVEAHLRPHGESNKSAGNMTAYYKLLGLVRSATTSNDSQVAAATRPQCEPAAGSGDSRGHQQQQRPLATMADDSAGSTNNNHLRHYLTPNTNRDAVQHMDAKPQTQNQQTQVAPPPVFSATHLQPLTPQAPAPAFTPHQHTATSNHTSPTGFQLPPSFRPEQLALAARVICSPLANRLQGQMFPSGQLSQNAFRWLRAMTNAASASARINQMQHADPTPPPACTGRPACGHSSFSDAQDSMDAGSMSSADSNPNREPLMNAAGCHSTPLAMATSNSSSSSPMNPVPTPAPIFASARASGCGGSMQLGGRSPANMKPLLDYCYAQTAANLASKPLLHPLVLQHIFLKKQREARSAAILQLDTLRRQQQHCKSYQHVRQQPLSASCMTFADNEVSPTAAGTEYPPADTRHVAELSEQEQAAVMTEEDKSFYHTAITTGVQES